MQGTPMTIAAEPIRSRPALRPSPGGADVPTTAEHGCVVRNAPATLRWALSAIAIAVIGATTCCDAYAEQVENSRRQSGFGGSATLASTYDVPDPIELETQQEPLQRAATLEVIGRSYFAAGLPERAVPRLQEALRLRREAHAEPRPEVAATLTDLGNAYREIGQFDEAVVLFQEALQILRATARGRSRECAVVLGVWGHLESARGNSDKALKLYNDSLKLTRRIEGRRHPDVAGILVHIANEHIASRNLRSAERLLREAVEILRLSRPAIDPDLAEAEQALGEALTLQGRVEEADAILSKVLETQQQLYGYEGLVIADTLEILAEVRFAQNRFEDGEELKLEAIASLEVFGKAQQFRIGFAKVGLGAQLVRIGDFTRAEQLLCEALEVYYNQFPANSGFVNSAQHFLAEALLGAGKLVEAESVLKPAIDDMRQHRESRWRIARSVNTMGEILYRQGQQQAGAKLLEQSYDELDDLTNVDATAMAKARQRREWLQESRAR